MSINPPSQLPKADPHQRGTVSGASGTPPLPPCPVLPEHEARVQLLRVFMDDHGIGWADIGKELHMGRDAVYVQLVHNKTLRRDTREKLLDLGFPEETLPPERKKGSPCFPGRRPADNSSQPLASAG